MKTQEFIIRARLTHTTLETWVEAGWLLPAREDAAPEFSDIDLARACLIRDLTHDLGVNNEGVAIILDLVDQMHGLRRSLREVRDVAAGGPAAPARSGEPTHSVTRSPRRGA